MKIGVIKERKSPPDRRVVFSPQKLAELQQKYPALEIKVESSDIRIFSDDEYRKAGNSIEGYINNLRYTNNKLKELVTNIQENTKGKAVIIVMGDHGYRSESLPKHDYFRNFNSIYLPPGYQSAYYDSVSGVNQFRVLFNTLFKTVYPLLKDSTVFLSDD